MNPAHAAQSEGLHPTLTVSPHYGRQPLTADRCKDQKSNLTDRIASGRMTLALGSPQTLKGVDLGQER